MLVCKKDGDFMTIDKKVPLKVIEANQYVHSYLVESGEYQKSPHFRPENQKKVRDVLLDLQKQTSGCERMVDFGCGTGFIINLVSDLYNNVYGVDITEEMMERVDVSKGNIHLVKAQAEATPFEGDFFDFATAYSFMDHLFDYKVFLKEVYRVLKKGGVFYSDLNPNRDFIVNVSSINQDKIEKYSDVVQREVRGALNNGEYYETEFGLDAGQLENAEPVKTNDLGFCADEVIEAAKLIGFSKCKVEYQWYIDQGAMIHEQPKGHAEIIEQYLQSLQPLSSSMFKYLRFTFLK
jgi:SAM-dependent methyltransferase